MFPLGEQDEELAEEMKENSVADDGNIGGCYSGFVRGMEGLREGRGGGAARGRAGAGGRTRFSCLPKHYHQQVVQFGLPPSLPPSLVAMATTTVGCNGYQVH